MGEISTKKVKKECRNCTGMVIREGSYIGRWTIGINKCKGKQDKMTKRRWMDSSIAVGEDGASWRTGQDDEPALL